MLRFLLPSLILATLASVVFGLSASFFVDYWKGQNPGDAQVYGYTFALLAGSSDVTRTLSSILGLRMTAQVPHSYLRHVPGMDVAVGVTAYQLASSTSAADIDGAPQD